jgi:hypothetical protein
MNKPFPDASFSLLSVCSGVLESCILASATLLSASGTPTRAGVSRSVGELAADSDCFTEMTSLVEVSGLGVTLRLATGWVTASTDDSDGTTVPKSERVDLAGT